MKATELRINNYHYYRIEDSLDERKEWDELCQIDPDDLKWLLKNPDDPDYKPVPLTEDWLIKFGFSKYDKDEIYYDGLFEFALNSYRQYWHFYAHNEVNGNKWILRDLQFVHQLQNIIYAITGQELTIKSDNQ